MKKYLQRNKSTQLRSRGISANYYFRSTSKQFENKGKRVQLKGVRFQRTSHLIQTNKKYQLHVPRARAKGHFWLLQLANNNFILTFCNCVTRNTWTTLQCFAAMRFKNWLNSKVVVKVFSSFDNDNNFVWSQTKTKSTSITSTKNTTKLKNSRVSQIKKIKINIEINPPSVSITIKEFSLCLKTAISF